MKPINDRSLANGSLVLLLAIGLVLLALLVLAPDYVQAGMAGLQPVSIRSGLQANYAADPLGLVIQPIDLKAVEQSIADRTTSTVSSRKQAAAAIEALNTPVYLVTPMQTQLTGRIPTSTKPVLRNTTAAATSTRQVEVNATATKTSLPLLATATLSPASTITTKPVLPTKPGLTSTPNTGIATLQPTRTPTSTKPPVVIPATQTAPPNKTHTWTPIPPSSATPKPPTRTFTPLPPTRTNTPAGYPAPATKTPGKTATLPAYP